MNIDKDILLLYLKLNKMNFNNNEYVGGYKLYSTNDSIKSDLVIDLNYSIINNQIYASLYTNDVYGTFLYHINLDTFINFQTTYQREEKLKQLGLD